MLNTTTAQGIATPSVDSEARENLWYARAGFLLMCLSGVCSYYLIKGGYSLVSGFFA